MNSPHGKWARRVLGAAGAIVMMLAVPALAQGPQGPGDVPGYYRGTGVSFEVSGDSLRLQATATDTILADVHLAGTYVLMFIEGVNEVVPTELALSGYPPNTDLYAFLDAPEDRHVVRTDDQGTVRFPLDLSQARMLVVQMRLNTLHLTATGWSDPSVGTWDPATMTGTLTRDVTDQISVDSPNLTLEGADHTCTWTGSGPGVSIQGVSGVTVRNLYVLARYDALVSGNSPGTTIRQCYLRTQVGTGAVISGQSGLFASSSATFLNNTLQASAGYGFYFYASGFISSFSATARENDVTALTPVLSSYGGWTGVGAAIYNNNFISPRPPNIVGGVSWSLTPPVGGNYWSAWTNPDANADGFVDAPYVFANGQDSWPYANRQPWGAPPLAIQASAGPGGVIVPSGAVSVAPGSNTLFTITPDPGFDVVNVIVDQVPVGPKTSYTFNEVVANHTISVVFVSRNRPPVLAAIPDQSVDELTAFSVTAQATDPDVPAQPLTYSLLAAPPGMTIDPASGQMGWTPPEQAGPGAYTVTVGVSDNQSPALSDSKSFTLHVREVNLPPDLAPIADQVVDEQQGLTIVASASDADLPANVLAYSLAPGAPEGASLDGGTFRWTPDESQGPGDYPITVQVTDDGSPALSARRTFMVHVNEVNRPPVLAMMKPWTQIPEMEEFTFFPSATDPDLPAQHLTFVLEEAPEGATIDPVTGVFAWTPREDQGPADHTFTVRVTDDGVPALSDEQRITIHVNEVNVLPALVVPGPIVVDEGATVAFTAAATDPDLPANTLTFSLVPPAPAGATIDPATGAVSWPTCDDADCVLHVAVSDGLGAEVVGDVPVTVRNVAPAVTIFHPGAGATYAVGEEVLFAGRFADPGSADTHTAVWTFDALTSPGVVNPAERSVTCRRAFSAPGVYLVKLTVTDDDGGSGVAATVDGMDAMIVVYDPTAGFVTGGGWIESPAGAYIPDPAIAGRANFGFVSKYLKGSTTPTGETEFQFRVAGLDFHSSAYEWLAVGGAKAQFRGAGVVNGGGDYGFVITAVDGDLSTPVGPDKFRIRIWARGTGATLYDNLLGLPDGTMPTTVLAGGQIQVHAGTSYQRDTDPLMAQGAAPVAFALGRVTPNPSRGGARLALDLPEACAVRISVLDVAGREVAEIANGAFEAGRHQVTWSGTGARGAPLEAGVYFVRVTAGSRTAMEKIVRIR